MSTSDAATEPNELREELRRAETRVRMLRESNAALEQRLLRPTAFRAASVAVLATALLAGTLAYVGAGKLGDLRAAREEDLAERLHVQRLAEERTIVDACNVSFRKTTNDVVRCRVERDELLQRARERVLANPRGAVRCNCQPGDPLCSCL